MAFPGELNINYYKGDTHEFKVYPQKTDGSVFLLTDYSNSTFTIAQSRGDAGVALGQINASARISSDGTHVVCAITPENSELMDASKTYVYDVQVYSQGADTYDKVFTLITGSISVTDDVTQDIGTQNKAIPTYRVIYHNTDATSGEPPTDSEKYFPTQSVTIKANTGSLARTGYYFAGWNTASDGLGTSYQVGSSISSFNTDIKLYPKWVVNTVAYDNQSATVSHSGGVTSYTATSAISTLPTVDPIRTGHTFGGWFTGPAGSGVQVTNGSFAPSFPYGPVILYAKWVPTYSVLYDDQSATTTYSGGSTLYAQGQSIPLIPTTPPIRTGHTFGGWFTGPAGSGVQVTNASYTPLSPYGAVTLYAKWTAA
jgi:uncharacterized repeat protein (TIGR02543 family)